MLQLGNLASFILGSIKDENSGRVALYHYIKNFCRPEEILSIRHINDFFAECLQMSYWIERKAELYSDTKELLVRFFNNQKSAFSLDPLWDLPHMQILSLTQTENLYQTVKSYEESFNKEGEVLKVMAEGDTRMVVIRRSPQGTLMIRTYNSVVRVQGHTLIPLIHDQQLFYNEILEIQTGVVQSLRISPHAQIRFEITPQGQILAQTLSGTAFRQSQFTQLKNLNEMQTLFSHLKKLERFYILKASDPYYVELMSSLDKALELVQMQEPDGLIYARKAFDVAQIAFDQVFPDDKALYLKLKELAKYMTLQSRSGQNKEVPLLDHRTLT